MREVRTSTTPSGTPQAPASCWSRFSITPYMRGTCPRCAHCNVRSLRSWTRSSTVRHLLWRRSTRLPRASRRSTRSSADQTGSCGRCHIRSDRQPRGSCYSTWSVSLVSSSRRVFAGVRAPNAGSRSTTTRGRRRNAGTRNVPVACVSANDATEPGMASDRHPPDAVASRVTFRAGRWRSRDRSSDARRARCSG